LDPKLLESLINLENFPSLAHLHISFYGDSPESIPTLLQNFRAPSQLENFGLTIKQTKKRKLGFQHDISDLGNFCEQFKLAKKLYKVSLFTFSSEICALLATIGLEILMQNPNVSDFELTNSTEDDYYHRGPLTLPVLKFSDWIPTLSSRGSWFKILSINKFNLALQGTESAFVGFSIKHLTITKTNIDFDGFGKIFPSMIENGLESLELDLDRTRLEDHEKLIQFLKHTSGIRLSLAINCLPKIDLENIYNLFDSIRIVRKFTPSCHVNVSIRANANWEKVHLIENFAKEKRPFDFYIHFQYCPSSCCYQKKVNRYILRR